MSWKEALWAELDEKPYEQQIMLVSQWITEITQDLLPELGRRRRQRVLDILAQDGWDATRLAETVGARRGTITRLAEEGRANRKEKHE